MAIEPEKPNAPTSSSRRAISLGTIAALGGGVLLLLFAVQNRDRVEIEFLWWNVSWREWILVVVSAVLGAVVWLGLGVLRRHSRRKERREERRG